MQSTSNRIFHRLDEGRAALSPITAPNKEAIIDVMQNLTLYTDVCGGDHLDWRFITNLLVTKIMQRFYKINYLHIMFLVLV